MNKIKQNDWIILFVFFISAVGRYLMDKLAFSYIDYFIAFVNLIGLDYTVTNIIYYINNNINEQIDKSNLISTVKNNKKQKHKKFLHISIVLIITYNLVHLFCLSNSTYNDMLSMIVLGITLTDTSISLYITDKLKL